MGDTLQRLRAIKEKTIDKIEEVGQALGIPRDDARMLLEVDAVQRCMENATDEMQELILRVMQSSVEADSEKLSVLKAKRAELVREVKKKL